MYKRKGISPDYDKVVLVPISVTTSTSTSSSTTSTTVTNVTNDLSLSNTRLIGGEENSRDPLKISIIYSKFKRE
jgi:hypothetical protein